MSANNKSKAACPRPPQALNGDIPKYLTRLSQCLALEGHTDVLAHLPTTDNIDFVEDEDAPKSLNINMGKDFGVIFAYLDDKVVRRNMGTGVNKPVDNSVFKYRSGFILPAPFGWDRDMQMGMQTPMDPRTLAIVRFYFVIWSFDHHYHDKDSPIPH